MTDPSGPVATITLEPSLTVVAVGSQRALSAILKDARGRTIDGTPVSWASSSPSVAAVAAGVVSGVSVGEATITAEAEGVTGSASVTVLERAANDRSDDLTGSQVHVLYVLPSDGVDNSLDVNGTLLNTFETVQRWLAAQTGGRRLRFDTFEGVIDLTFLRLDATRGELASDPDGIAERLVEELAAAGFDDPLKMYVTYFEGTAPGPCSYRLDEATVRRVFFILEQCADVEFPSAPSDVLQLGSSTFLFIHDLLHTLGYVFPGAPHERERHTTDDPRDVMHYLDGPTETPILLDVGRDDYYGENVPPGVPNFADSPLLTGP